MSDLLYIEMNAMDICPTCNHPMAFHVEDGCHAFLRDRDDPSGPMYCRCKVKGYNFG